MTWSVHPGVAALAVLLLTACATPQGPGGTLPGGTAKPDDPVGSATPDDPVGSVKPPAARGEVVGQGTVLQAGDEPPRFCLGGVMESYPPQCSGPEIANWDWAAAEQAETASGVTWGAYAVTGTWNGTVFTRTGSPIPLALYDSMPLEDPTAGRPGSADQQDLDRIQQEISGDDAPGLLGTGLRNGFVTVTVVYDDGSLQARLESEYGAGVVLVESALRPVP